MTEASCRSDAGQAEKCPWMTDATYFTSKNATFMWPVFLTTTTTKNTMICLAKLDFLNMVPTILNFHTKGLVRYFKHG